MKYIIILMLWMICASQGYTQYSSYTLGATAEQIIDRLQGDSIIILNPEVKCVLGSETYGLYEGVGELGIDTGLVISYSSMSEIFSPYQSALNYRALSLTAYPGIYDTNITRKYVDPMLHSWGLPSEAYATNKNCALSMDVVSLRSNIELSYVLGDTHFEPGGFCGGYNYWLNYSHLHCFPSTNVIGIFISGGAYTDTVNYAVFAQGDDDVRKRKPVNRYTLRMNQEMFDYYCASADEDTMLFSSTPMLDFLRYNTDGALVPDINFSGFSTRMDVSIPVQVCDTHHLVFIVNNTNIFFRDESGDIITPESQNTGTGLFISPLRGTGADSCVSTTGIDGTTGDMHIGMYPNPFSDRVLITTPYAQRTYTVQVTDLLGRRYGERLTGTAAQLEVLLAERIQQLSIQQWYLFTITDPATGRSTTFKMRKE